MVRPMFIGIFLWRNGEKERSAVPSDDTPLSHAKDRPEKGPGQ
jgi:hypothetical protein